MDYELEIREKLLARIEDYFGYMENLYLLSTQELVLIAETLQLKY